MKCEGCPFHGKLPEQGKCDGCPMSFGCGFAFHRPASCHLTPAAMNLVRLLIEHGISDKDAELVESAIAGEGRLVLREVCCETCRHFTPWKYYDGEIMWECGGKGYLDPPKQPCGDWQDQGGE